MYKIISRTSSFLERSVTFSVDGKIETISAPAATTTFDDLLLRIEQEYGDGKDKTVTVKADDKPTEDPTPTKTTTTTAPAKGRKKTSQK